MASLIRSWRELDLAKTAHGWGPLWLPLLHKPNSACHLQRLATTNVMSRANMSSFRSFSEPEAKSSLERAGFYLIKDNDEGRTDSEDFTGKGKLFAQFYDAGYYTKTPQGLEFIFQNTWGDTAIRSILQSIIEQPRWGYTRFFSDRLSSEYAWFFHNRDKSNAHEAIHTLVVQFWLPGSRAVYYKGSQLQFFDAKQDPENWGVLKTPRHIMKKEGITATVEDMPHGGYTIIDSRLGWTCEGGGFMNIGYGSDEEVAEWGKMKLPDTDALRKKVAELEKQGCRTNFTYVKLPMPGAKNT